MDENVSSIKIISMNARGLRNNVKRRDVFKWLREHKYDICCLQDFHCTNELENVYRSEWGGNCLFSNYSSASRGVAILFNGNFEYHLHDNIKDPQGNYILLDISINKQRFTFGSIYGPNKDCPNFFVKLFEEIECFQNASIVLCGDWNIVMEYDKDTRNYKGQNNRRARDILRQKIESMELFDVWRIQHQHKKTFTWYKSVKSAQMARLDYFLVSNDIMSLSTKSDIIPGYGTDHSAITLDLNVGFKERGKGFWKFNASVLHNREYVDLVKETISKTIEQYLKPGQDITDKEVQLTISDQLFFEMLKLEIRGQSIKFCSELKRKMVKQENELEKEIIGLKRKVDTSNSILVREQLERKQKELEDIRLPKVKGTMLRAKSRYYEEGEKPTKYFCNLERRNYISKAINRLIVNDIEITNPAEILNQQNLYYKNLYSSKLMEKDEVNVHAGFFLKEDNVNALTNHQKQMCEGKVTLEELKSVLKGMSNGKSPGSDGFTVEFYKFFMPDLGHFLVRSLNCAFRLGELSLTQKQGVITCLPKGDKPREYLKNWRPISLLNVDYKLLAGVLASRMKQVLSSVISETQKGFLKNRFIAENTRLVYDVMYDLMKSKGNGVLLLIDFEKAFDSLEWSYILKVLKAYNFGNDFIKWFQTLYKDAKSTVINNGYFSEFFNISRGCRQGDPLSPYIFILCVESLAMEIKQERNIKGLKLGKYVHKIGQYADDTYLLQDGSVESILRTFEILDMFQSCSGLKANVDKTQAVWLGPKNQQWLYLQNRVRLKWVDKFTLLGIHFDVNVNNMVHTNFVSKMAEIERVLNMYKPRNLSLIGKITVVKTLAIPKLIHALQTLPSPPEEINNKIKNIIRKFLWNNKRAKISLEQLYKAIDDGGLALTDLKLLCLSLKVGWVKRLIMTEGGWQNLFRAKICTEKELVWQLDNYSLKCFAKNVCNPFWKEVFECWRKYSAELGNSSRGCMNFPLWNSWFMKNKNLCARKSEMIQKGVIYINDLIKEEGKFMEIEEFKEMYNVKVNFLDYNALIHSIPYGWKRSIIENCSRRLTKVTCGHLDYVIKAEKCCRDVYQKMLTDHSSVIEKLQAKWANVTGDEMSEEELRQGIKVLFECTVEVKLRSFQYHIINKTLVTNKHLFLWKIKDSDKCYFCGSCVESIEHLLLTCNKVSKFWQDVCSEIQRQTSLKLDITFKTVIIGKTYPTQNRLINHVLLIVKRYIYVCRCLCKSLSIEGVVKFIKRCFLIERQIIHNSSDAVKVKNFEEKWKSFYEWFLARQ